MEKARCCKQEISKGQPLLPSCFHPESDSKKKMMGSQKMDPHLMCIHSPGFHGLDVEGIDSGEFLILQCGLGPKPV